MEDLIIEVKQKDTANQKKDKTADQLGDSLHYDEITIKEPSRNIELVDITL